LAAGDALLTPVQSPETMGYDLEARAAGRVVGDVEDRAAAEEHFRAARDTYARAALLRGVAVADLRLAWLHRLSGQAEEAVSLSRKVAEQFGTAGDRAGRVLALTHLVLAELAAGRLSASRPGPVEEIAGWGAGSGSHSFAVDCVGILHTEACALADSGSVEVALVAFDLARRLQRALGERKGEALLVSHLGQLYGRLNSRGATIATTEEAVTEAMAAHGGFRGVQ
jgi:hypothetical protein